MGLFSIFKEARADAKKLTESVESGSLAPQITKAFDTKEEAEDFGRRMVEVAPFMQPNARGSCFRVKQDLHGKWVANVYIAPKEWGLSGDAVVPAQDRTNASVDVPKAPTGTATQIAEERQSQLKLLIARGKEQGYLTYAEVNDHLPCDIVDPEQIEDIVNMINDMGIPVYEKQPVQNSVVGPNPSESRADSDEEIWAKALKEYESGARRPGLFARLYAESDGDESKTKAAYIRVRAKELSAESPRVP
jgi:hypothetical protein